MRRRASKLEAGVYSGKVTAKDASSRKFPKLSSRQPFETKSGKPAGTWLYPVGAGMPANTGEARARHCGGFFAGTPAPTG